MKLNVIGLTAQASGCGFHRVILPVAFMNDIKGYVTNVITEDRSKGWDILLYNRISVYDKHWAQTKDTFGFKVVLDLDDYWRLPPNHLSYNQYESMGKRIENNIREANLVTVTNEALAAKVREFTDNVVVVPNAIPFGQHQFTDERREDERVRIFWCGGITHEHDLRILRNPIQKLKAYGDKIKMVIGGWTDAREVKEKYLKGDATLDQLENALYTESIWKRMHSSFTAGGALPYMKIHGTTNIQYMQMYENADIMIIPLEESEWHSCKSNLKILEAACKRIPVIVSNVAPYNQDPEAPVLWVNSQKDWFTHLNYLINNPIERQELGNKLYEWAKSKYSLDRVNERRREAFASLCEAPACV